jgi:hypothetical protein
VVGASVGAANGGKLGVADAATVCMYSRVLDADASEIRAMGAAGNVMTYTQYAGSSTTHALG